MIEFYEETHEYREGSRIVPGVTTVLKSSGLLRAYGKPEDLQRGRLVHKMCHMHFDRDLDLETLPAWLEPYHDGVTNWQSETGFVPESWEQRIYDPRHGYAGTYDVKGRMRRWPRVPVLVDFKTGDVADWTAIQLAAYTLGKPHIRIAVGLSPGLRGGKNYNCTIYGLETLAHHMRVYFASLTVAKFILQGA